MPMSTAEADGTHKFAAFSNHLPSTILYEYLLISWFLWKKFRNQKNLRPTQQHNVLSESNPLLKRKSHFGGTSNSKKEDVVVVFRQLRSFVFAREFPKYFQS